MSRGTLYLRAAEELRENEGQWQAYESQGHCVVLAGPGSGKTKTMTIKLARILSEDIKPPRGVACITYNNECAREVEQRLAALGVEPGRRVFIGTVHSFSLTQILIPYGQSLGVGLPDRFEIASQQQQQIALAQAYRDVVGGPANPESARFGMDLHRRSYVNRERPEWRRANPERAALSIAYEGYLRGAGLIDMEDMPLLALRALIRNPWLRRGIAAKYPVLAVDEYQDLGLALHQMVLGLCFRSGVRMLAVGDADQSIYGFIGARPELLQRLSEREDVETVTLGLNYRSGRRIVAASEFALGEVRGYRAAEGAVDGTVYFHPLGGTYDDHADHLFAVILPEIEARNPGLERGKIGILYAAAFMGDAVSSAAVRYDWAILRTDGNAMYPRSSRLMRWLEQCAAWCCGGWRSAEPRWARIASQGIRLLSEKLRSDEHRSNFKRALLAFLLSTRDGTLSIARWLEDFDTQIVQPHVVGCRAMGDDIRTLRAFQRLVSSEGTLKAMTLGQFAGMGEGNDRVNLSTLHSSKGREFDVVILFGMDEGRVPRANPTPPDVREARRLFYVGFTRTRSEIHMTFSANRPSRFVEEIAERLDEL